MKHSKYNINSWPMQEIYKYPKYDGWRICSCPWTSKRRTELQNIHLSAPGVKCRWSAKHCWKNRPMVSPSRGWLSAPFGCSEDRSGIRHLDALFRNTLSVRDFAVPRGRQKDILPRPTEFLAKGKYAQSCVGAQGLLVYSGLLSITGCFRKPVELNWALVPDSGTGGGPVKLATLSRLF